MTGNRKVAIWAIVILGLGGILATGRIAVRIYRKHRPIILRGAVIKQDNDPRKQSPIANVEISSPDGAVVRDAKSDFSGSFRLTLRPDVKLGQPIRLAFRHPDFQPLDLIEMPSDKLYVVRMTPLHGEVEAQLNQAEVVVGNVLVRYSTETTKTENIGSAVKTFQVVNSGNVTCSRRIPCSPDEKWKAQVGYAALDAGEGNVFRDARVTCIAGPCPFTRVDTDDFSRGGRVIKVTVRDWSDTTTFLFQAEVFRTQLDAVIRRSFPVIFGRAMNFTLPSTAEGPTIEAEMNGVRIEFPLGPAPVLSWANCEVHVQRNQGKDYRCELKAGYRFR
ncbi:MAG: hypothetical protein WBQ89_15570 [Candidatus Acidiferrum sp.]